MIINNTIKNPQKNMRKKVIKEHIKVKQLNKTTRGVVICV